MVKNTDCITTDCSCGSLIFNIQCCRPYKEEKYSYRRHINAIK